MQKRDFLAGGAAFAGPTAGRASAAGLKLCRVAHLSPIVSHNCMRAVRFLAQHHPVLLRMAAIDSPVPLRTARLPERTSP